MCYIIIQTYPTTFNHYMLPSNVSYLFSIIFLKNVIKWPLIHTFKWTGPLDTVILTY